MKKSQIIAIAVAVVVLLWVISGFFGGTETQDASSQTAGTKVERALPEVRVRLIKAQGYTNNVVVTGRSQASRKVQMRAETAGQIQELLKEEGETVAKDDLLAKIEIRDRESRVREARERVNQRQIQYNAARRLAGEGFNSKISLAQALADLENAKAVLKDAQTSLTKTDIAAPFDAIIAVQNIDPGDYMSVGDNMFTLVDLDPIELVGFVSENRVRDLEIGKQATAEFLNDQIIEGTLSYIAPAADEQTRTFRVIVSASNTDYKIKEGLTAKISIPASMRSAFKISPSILSLDARGKIGVKIVNDQDVVTFIPVKILADKPDAMWIEFEGGDAPSQARFITVGQEFVSAGEPVKPVLTEGDGLL